MGCLAAAGLAAWWGAPRLPESVTPWLPELIRKPATWLILHGMNRAYRFLVAAGLLVFAGALLRNGGRRTPREWARFAGRTVLLVVSLTLSLVAGEMGLRTYYSVLLQSNSFERLQAAYKQGKKLPVHGTHPLAAIIRPSADPRVVYELQPGLQMDFGHNILRINSAGMRSDREYAPAKPPNTIRIVGIGDSGMFGWGVDQGEDYLSVLETNLNARGDGVAYEVLNMGVPGYNTQLEYECLRSKGLAYQPDIVVVGWCDNDYGLPMFLLEKKTLNFRRRDVSFLNLALFNRPKFITLTSDMDLLDQRSMTESNVLPELRAGTDVEGVRQAMTNLRDLGRREGFKLLVFGPIKQPQLFGILKDLEIPYFNTREKIDRAQYPEDYLVHYMHPRPGGHRVLAEHLERDLRARGWLKPVAP